MFITQRKRQDRELEGVNTGSLQQGSTAAHGTTRHHTAGAFLVISTRDTPTLTPIIHQHLGRQRRPPAATRLHDSLMQVAIR